MNASVSHNPLWRRFSVKELLLWALFVVIVAVVMNSCRKGMGLLSDGEFAERVAQGDPLVQAVYNYRARTGEWPRELTSEALAGATAPDYFWHYKCDAATPPILILSPIMHCNAQYHFPDYSTTPLVIDNTWKISGESVRWKRVQSTATPPTQINPAAEPVKGWHP